MADDDNLMGALAYVFGWLTGLIVYFLRRDSKFVRFHAIQSIILSVVVIVILIVAMVLLWIAGIILALATQGLGMLLIPLGMLLLMAAVVLLAVFLVYKAYSGVIYKLPVIGNIAERHS